MSQAEKTELEKNFKTLDKDGDGRLSIEELIEGFLINSMKKKKKKSMKKTTKKIENLHEKI